MPLKAIFNEVPIYAHQYSQSAWADLKDKYRSGSLKMPCCSSLAIPRTSKLGTFHFSHKAKGECVSQPESNIHLYLKFLIAKVAERAGWDTKTETQGYALNGDRWVADVLCQKGSRRVVFEVQMSPQSLGEFERRQIKYQQSGVRCVWLINGNDFLERSSSKKLPIFSVDYRTSRLHPNVPSFSVGLDAFVIGVLNKKLRWRSSSKQVQGKVLTMYLNKVRCGFCNTEQNLMEAAVLNKQIASLGDVRKVLLQNPEYLYLEKNLEFDSKTRGWIQKCVMCSQTVGTISYRTMRIILENPDVFDIDQIEKINGTISTTRHGGEWVYVG